MNSNFVKKKISNNYKKICLKNVILVPHAINFENPDIPGAEATYLYNSYFKNSKVIQIYGNDIIGRLYVVDNIGLYVIGEGKANSAASMSALLSSQIFELESSQYILCGSCGCAHGRGVVGDVYIIDTCIDYDFGNIIDSREVDVPNGQTWFPDLNLSHFANIKLNSKIVTSIFEKYKEEKIFSSDKLTNIMGEAFDGAKWSLRHPKVIQGTSVTSDSYWKGNYKHQIADEACKVYKTKFPYYATVMEDTAVARVLFQYDKLDNLVIIRYSVNMDTFLKGQNPQNLWMNNDFHANVGSPDGFNEFIPDICASGSKICWDIVNS